ncbi:MAG TPA: GNAT family N-acetyltransferase [Bdellovibrionales bacterium]|nr:GNAT family N-acetyltransferase [Bdellovibrionales bacterium]
MKIRPIQRSDNAQIARIIRDVMTSFGAVGEGFSIQDPEVDAMYEAYTRPRCAYFVVCDDKDDSLVLGGAGIAPLAGGDPGVCELKKMYFREEARGHGLGQKLIDLCLAAAKAEGFKLCYLETLKTMTAAKRLYEKNGFQPSKPLGKTGHFGCDSWYAKPL